MTMEDRRSTLRKDAIKLVLATLATYRLSQLLAWDKGPLSIFYHLRSYVKDKADMQQGLWENIDEGINCPYCLGMYFSLICVILFLGRKNILLNWLGVAGGQAFLQGITKTR